MAKPLARKIFSLREATLADLDFLVRVDMKDEGVSSAPENTPEQTEAEKHRNKIKAFILDKDKGAWVYEDTKTNRLVGMILWRYRDRLNENFEPWCVFGRLDASLFPKDGVFCEIFQLWISPSCRRQGLASRLKLQAEAESLHRGIKLLYTHTEERNTHVIEMNLKLGYHEVRRGPLWDDVVRVSLIKPLGHATG